MTKVTKIILIFLFAILFATSLFLGYRYYQVSKGINSGDRQELKLKGVVKQGKDISPQSGYCPSEFYIVTNETTLQLRTPDGIEELASALYAKYRNSEVEIKATFRDLPPNCDSGNKDCGCDQFILVNSVNETKAADLQGFATFRGKIACLPLKDGSPVTPDTCALGLITNDGKNYILKNATEADLVANKEVEIIGEAEKGKVESLYVVDGIINVIKIQQ